MAKAIPLHLRTTQRCSTRDIFRMGTMASGANDGTGEIVAACASTYCASRLEITVAVTAPPDRFCAHDRSRAGVGGKIKKALNTFVELFCLHIIGVPAK